MRKLHIAALLLSAAWVPAPALAQEHAEHSAHAEPAPAPEEESCVISLDGGQLACTQPGDQARGDHAQMDHSQMDHGQTSQRVEARGAVDHAAMGHAMLQGCIEVGSGHGFEPDGTLLSWRTRQCAPVSASGTSLLPAEEGMMPGVHFDLDGGWSGMAHGYAWGAYTDQGGPRGDDMAFVQSMAMVMAERRFEGGRVQLKAMLSADPLMGDHGYPLLFAAGETAGGEPLVDRQHPHDLFMELAGRVDLDIAEGTTAYLYGGPVGEPALGPPAFMHRASARLNPEAPISHHWFDSTHITFGVVTAGVASPLFQLEASAFRGQEPDEDRWDIEEPRLDSWSVRGTLTPSPHWALQASYGRLDQPEALHPGEDEGRATASVHYASGDGLSATAAFSAKDRIPGPTRTAWLAEANWDITDRHTLFGRFENVENDELFPDHTDPLHDMAFRVTKLQAGYAYTLPAGPFDLALGGSVATFLKPDALDAVYGEDPMGYTLFAKLTLAR